MKQLGNAGVRIISFKTIFGLTDMHMKNVSSSGYAIKIFLDKSNSIHFYDVDNDWHTITSKQDQTPLIIFGNNIMFSQEKLRISDN